MRYLILALTLLFFVLGSVRFLPTNAQTPDWTTYEDYDPLVMAGYSTGEWQSVADGNVLGGQLTHTSTPNATLTLYFQVTEPSGGYSIIYSKAPDGGDFQVQLDETTYGPFTSYSASPLYNQEISHVDLPTGTYTLVITNLSDTFKLEAIRIQGQLVSSPIYSPTPTGDMIIPTPTPSDPTFSPQVASPYVIVNNAAELIAAIDNTDSGGSNNIYLEPGDYSLTASIYIPLFVSVNLYGTRPITVYSPAADGIKITGPTEGVQAAFYLSGYSTLNLHHLRLTSGITTRNYAGVIRNDGVVNLYDSVIENTKTSLGAGGIYNYGILNIVRSAFRGNQAGGGGAIQNEITASLTAQCTLFQENQADYGGAVLHAASGSVVISNSRFVGNSLTGLYPDVDSRDIHNLGDNGSLPTINAQNNQWASGIGIDDVNGTGTSIQTSPTLSSDPLLTTNCQNPLPDLPYEQCPASANIQEATALSPTCQIDETIDCNLLPSPSSSYCNELANHSVVLKARNSDSVWADWLVKEVYFGVLQVAHRFYASGCLTVISYCTETIMRDQPPNKISLFQEVITKGNATDSGYLGEVADKVVFALHSGSSSTSAAMDTNGEYGVINIYVNGFGLNNCRLDETEQLGKCGHPSEKQITRYLVSHELMHILSWRSGGLNYGQCIYREGNNLYNLAHYIRKEKFGNRIAFKNAPIAYSFYPEAYDLTANLNNWPEDAQAPTQDPNGDCRRDLGNLLEEMSAEALNIWIWQGLTSTRTSQPLGYTSASQGQALIAIVEGQLPFWLALGSDPICSLDDASACGQVPRN